jgi:hypothetical protein
MKYRSQILTIVIPFLLLLRFSIQLMVRVVPHMFKSVLFVVEFPSKKMIENVNALSIANLRVQN